MKTGLFRQNPLFVWKIKEIEYLHSVFYKCSKVLLGKSFTILSVHAWLQFGFMFSCTVPTGIPDRCACPCVCPFLCEQESFVKVQSRFFFSLLSPSKVWFLYECKGLICGSLLKCLCFKKVSISITSSLIFKSVNAVSRSGWVCVSLWASI